LGICTAAGKVAVWKVKDTLVGWGVKQNCAVRHLICAGYFILFATKIPAFLATKILSEINFPERTIAFFVGYCAALL
jgi:hypothetical protein